MGTPTPPTITSTKASNGNVILTGTGGLAGVNFYVLASTNLTVPQSNWIVLSTNAVSTTAGNFSITNSMGASRVEFFRVLVP